MNTFVSPLHQCELHYLQSKFVPQKQFFACISRKNEFTVKILLTKIEEQEILYKNDIYSFFLKSHTNRKNRCVEAGSHMRTKRFANSSHQALGKLIFCKPEANTGHPAYPIPFMFAQKNRQILVRGELFLDAAVHVRSPIDTTRIWFAYVYRT